ncbi:MAG: ABC transporter ATP-binding protein [Pusillimonas sp.]
MSKPILETQALTKRYGGLLVTDGVSIEVREGELHAVIGPNGAGKTTLINQLSGELFPDSGQVLFSGRNITALPIHDRARLGVVRSYQVTSIFEGFTVLENVVLSALGATSGAWQIWRPLLGNSALVGTARRVLETTRLLHRADVAVAELAYGERRQLELAMALSARPKVLLLDEPMAGMSPQESTEVIALLKALKGSLSILLIEHDMDAVFALADRITVLVYGKVLCTGAPDEIRTNAEVKTVYLGDDEIGLGGV